MYYRKRRNKFKRRRYYYYGWSGGPHKFIRRRKKIKKGRYYNPKNNYNFIDYRGYVSNINSNRISRLHKKRYQINWSKIRHKGYTTDDLDDWDGFTF